MANDTHRTTLPAANVESHIGDEPVGAEEAARLDTRLSVRVISYRKRRHDPDGVSVKAILDGIVRAGILPDDSTDIIKRVAFDSVKSDEEKTVIEIA